MDVRRRDRIAIWVLAALCVVLSMLLVVSVVTSNAEHLRRGVAQPGQSSSGPAGSPGRTATPTPGTTPTPNQGLGSGGGSVGGGSGSGGGTGGGTGSIDLPSPSYAIGGSLAQALRPGSVYPLDLTLRNLGGAAMTVLDLHVTIAHVTAPNATPSRPCTVSDFGVVQVADGFSVALGAFESTSLGGRGVPSSQWPQISMLNTAANQDGCKGATLTLSFTGSSTVTT
jgi:hypothetical protein